jgi:hypothetical protein
MGFMGGFASGLDTGAKIVGAFQQGQEDADKAEARDAVKAGMENAKVSREGAVTDAVTVGGKANASDTMTMPTFEVDGKDYGSKDAAHDVADKKVGSVMDFFYKNEAPKIGEMYMGQGDPEKAEAWNSWVKDRNVQKGFEHGVKAMRDSSTGNDDGAMDNLQKMYNTPGYFEDGQKFKSWAPIKNDKGETTGYAATITDADGNDQVHNINKGEDLMGAVQTFSDPKGAFEATRAAQQSAKAGQLDFAKGELGHQYKMEEAGVKAETQYGLEDQRQNGRVALQGIKSQQSQAAAKQDQAARSAAALDLKAAGDPQEAKVKLMQTLSKTYVDLQGAPTKTPQEIGAMADQFVQQAYGQSNSLKGGLPAAGAPPAGVSVLDTKTGKIIQR